MGFCWKRYYLQIDKLMGRLLITRPEHDPTVRYLSRWSEQIIKEAEKKGMEVIDLYREKANRKRFIGTLEKSTPELVVLNGHGNKDFVAGHDDEVILLDSDKKAVHTKIIFARSCQSAQILGQKAIANGAIAYLGYTEDFWLMYNPAKLSRPLKDTTAALFLEPSNYLATTLLKGHSTGAANQRSKAFFRKNIERLLVAGPLSEDYDAIKLLYWDMTHQVCLGNENATL